MGKKGFQIACQNTGKKETILPIFSKFQVKQSAVSAEKTWRARGIKSLTLPLPRELESSLLFLPLHTMAHIDIIFRKLNSCNT